ncbi:MAG TPA: hypothetical protein VM287_10770 [Egibacteraceae bacterium]|nr:hypothetical protein [Egibacteraceae bacterium]
MSTPRQGEHTEECLMDENAMRIRDLIVDTCVATQPLERLLHTRAELLALVEDTGDPEAADAACGAVAEIDATVDARSAAPARRQAS